MAASQFPQCVGIVNGSYAYTVTPCQGVQCPHAAQCAEREYRENGWQHREQRFEEMLAAHTKRVADAWYAYAREWARSNNSLLAYRAFHSVKYPGKALPFEHLLPKAQPCSSNV